MSRRCTNKKALTFLLRLLVVLLGLTVFSSSLALLTITTLAEEERSVGVEPGPNYPGFRRDILNIPAVPVDKEKEDKKEVEDGKFSALQAY